MRIKDKIATVVYVVLMAALMVFCLWEVRTDEEYASGFVGFVYYFAMPVLALIWGFIVGQIKPILLIPVIAGALAAVMYIFASEASIAIDMGVPSAFAASFITALIGVAIRRSRAQKKAEKQAKQEKQEK